MDEGFLNLHDGSNFLDSDIPVTQKLKIYLFNPFFYYIFIEVTIE